MPEMTPRFRCCTAVYDNVHGGSETPTGRSNYNRREVIIAFRVTRSLAERIASYQSIQHKESRTDVFMDLLETALYIMEMPSVDEPTTVKYFQENL